jgi:hypothetical protein
MKVNIPSVRDEFIISWWGLAREGTVSWEYVRGLCHGIAMETTESWEKSSDYEMLRDVAAELGSDQQWSRK